MILSSVILFFHVLQACAWYITLVEIFTIHSSSFRRLTSFSDASNYATLDVPFLVSFTVYSFFFFLRVYSFRVLGDLFTTVVTVRPDHKLMTAGPYRFVRHPSYTAIFGMIVGNVMLHLSVTDSGAVKWVFWSWTLLTSSVASRLWSRSKQEDEMLRKKFGAEWEAYRERVPYRLVPGLM